MSASTRRLRNLSGLQQRVLYDFYLPRRDLTPSELQALRAEVSAARPHLPAQAGKVFNHVYAVFCRAFELAAGDETRFYAELRKLTAGQPRASKVYAAQGVAARRISVYPRLRPEPDVDRLVHALLLLAEACKRPASRIYRLRIRRVPTVTAAAPRDA